MVQGGRIDREGRAPAGRDVQDGPHGAAPVVADELVWIANYDIHSARPENLPIKEKFGIEVLIGGGRVDDRN